MTTIATIARRVFNLDTVKKCYKATNTERRGYPNRLGQKTGLSWCGSLPNRGVEYLPTMSRPPGTAGGGPA